MNTFVVWWDLRKQFGLGAHFAVPTSRGQANRIMTGDWVYVVTLGEQPRVLARLYVVGTQVEQQFKRITLDVNSHRTAFFAKNHNTAPCRAINLPRPILSMHKEVALLDQTDADVLHRYCEDNEDFSRLVLPLNWEGIVHQASSNVRQRVLIGDVRSDLEITVEYLMTRYTTPELPGPGPVYLNAALKVLESSLIDVPDNRSMGRSIISQDELLDELRLPGALGETNGLELGLQRKVSPLTDAAIKAGINKNIAEMSVYSPDSRKHQEILKRLRDRLLDLGLEPERDSLVDCRVRLGDRLIYFEVKSCGPGSVRKSMRTGVGQVLDYLWMDSITGGPEISGHLVLEDRVGRESSIPAFVESLSLGFTWSNDLEGLTAAQILQPGHLAPYAVV